jgi:hypothetical protein
MPLKYYHIQSAETIKLPFQISSARNLNSEKFELDFRQKLKAEKCLLQVIIPYCVIKKKVFAFIDFDFNLI